MKSRLITLLSAVILCCSARGQDTLIFKNGERLAVNITKETARNVEYKKQVNKSPESSSYVTSKKKLTGIVHKDDSILFAAMTPSEFYSLGEKHAKEYGSASPALINNSDYMNGFTNKLIARKNTLNVIGTGVGIGVITALIAVSTNSSAFNTDYDH